MTDGRQEEGPTADESDPRVWPRGAGDVLEATLWTSVEHSQQVEVLNESVTGIAVLVDDASKLNRDSEVRLIVQGEPMWALVRHVGPEKDGKRQVGLEWGCSDSRIAPLDFPASDAT